MPEQQLLWLMLVKAQYSYLFNPRPLKGSKRETSDYKTTKIKT